MLEGDTCMFHYVLDVYTILGIQTVLAPSILKLKKKQLSYAKRCLNVEFNFLFMKFNVFFSLLTHISFCIHV